MNHRVVPSQPHHIFLISPLDDFLVTYWSSIGRVLEDHLLILLERNSNWEFELGIQSKWSKKYGDCRTGRDMKIIWNEKKWTLERRKEVEKRTSEGKMRWRLLQHVAIGDHFLVGFHVSLSYNRICERIQDEQGRGGKRGKQRERERETVEQKYRRSGLKEWRKEGVRETGWR